MDVRSGFVDRTAAGEVLAAAVADALGPEVPGSTVVVLGLPRGGIPVAAVVARRLGATLDLLAVRKVGTPGHVELAIGAIASGGLVFINEPLVAQLGLRQREVEARLDVARRELEDQERRLRGDRPRPELEGRVVILVDDGVATGATAVAALRWARGAGAARVVFAAPVGPEGIQGRLSSECDASVILQTPFDMRAVGQWYERFEQVGDDDVRRALAKRSA